MEMRRECGQGLRDAWAVSNTLMRPVQDGQSDEAERKMQNEILFRESDMETDTKLRFTRESSGRA